MKFWISAVVLLALAGSAVIAGRLGWFAGEAPTDLGVRDGKLKPPSPTPNSVSSQAEYWPDAAQRRRASIAPLRYQEDAATAMRCLREVLQRFPGATVVIARDDYLYVQFTTRWLRFVDDAEFLLAPGEGVIHVRSASRVGYGDLGTNRRRIEAIRAEFDA